MDVDKLIEAVIAREGSYSNHPADRGGKTRWGITETVARAQGYEGAMNALPRSIAVTLYRTLYWHEPRLDDIAKISAIIAEKLFDCGVNMGPRTAIRFLQRGLNALNRQEQDYADLANDGRIGPATLAALRAFQYRRGQQGEKVLRRAIEALQATHYIHLAEQRPANEAFLYGWLSNRIGTL